MTERQIENLASVLNSMKNIEDIKKKDADYKIKLIFDTIIDVLIEINPIADKKIESIKELKVAMKYALSAIPFGIFALSLQNDHEEIKETTVDGDDPTMVKHVLKYLENINSLLKTNSKGRKAIARDLDNLRKRIDL